MLYTYSQIYKLFKFCLVFSITIWNWEVKHLFVPKYFSVDFLKTRTRESYGKVKVLVAQLYATLCDCDPPGSSVHGISQTRVLEWVAIPFFRGSSLPRNWTRVSHIADRFFTSWATRNSLRCVAHIKNFQFPQQSSL